MKILVTGGTGFIGKHLVIKLRSEGHEVRTVSRSNVTDRTSIHKIEDVQCHYNALDQHYLIDLSSEVLVRRMFAHWSPDVICHLAGNPLAKPDPVAPTAILDDNIKATQNLLHWCPEGTHFLFASSIVVYGDPKPGLQGLDVYDAVIPCKEDDVCKPTSLYASTKLCSENIIKNYANYRGIKYKILRLCATVGPGLTHGILKDFIHKVKTEEKLEMFGNKPGSCKPYIHVEDVVNVFSLLLSDERNAVMNLCSRWSLTVDEVADIVMEELGIFREKVWLGEKATWKGDNQILSANPSLAESFGWNKERDSKEALRKAIHENS